MHSRGVLPCACLPVRHRRHLATIDRRAFMDMYPTGRLVYVRRLKRLAGWKRKKPRWDVIWDAVWIDPERMVKEAGPSCHVCLYIGNMRGFGEW